MLISYTHIKISIHYLPLTCPALSSSRAVSRGGCFGRDARFLGLRSLPFAVCSVLSRASYEKLEFS
jgi:hypothetical protein